MSTEKRLIDANALMELARSHVDGVVDCNDIARFPKVDAVEVVHGRWIRRHNETKCSRCKFIYYSNRDDFNYCPNCGAKMDGGDENG